MLINYFRLVAVLLLVVGNSACDRQNIQSPLEKLQIELGEAQLTISPGHIPVETLLHIQIRTEKQLSSLSAVIVGKSMYMGKIPLRFTFDDKTGTWRSDFMLGACSDPEMLWQLQMLLTDQSGNQRQLETEFQSSWH
ncbi:MAG: hypothetical protein KKA56_00735 [Gammaproteobacteria bacterium]|nr:hypothetical protein [Gammaproteobacteria bacterium]